MNVEHRAWWALSSRTGAIPPTQLTYVHGKYMDVCEMPQTNPLEHVDRDSDSDSDSDRDGNTVTDSSDSDDVDSSSTTASPTTKRRRCDVDNNDDRHNAAPCHCRSCEDPVRTRMIERHHQEMIDGIDTVSRRRLKECDSERVRKARQRNALYQRAARMRKSHRASAAEYALCAFAYALCDGDSTSVRCLSLRLRRALGDGGQRSVDAVLCALGVFDPAHYDLSAATKRALKAAR